MGNLKVVVDGGHQQYYLPGQTLSGRVEYTMSSQEELSQVVITLDGQSFSDIVTVHTTGNGGTNHHHHKEPIELFHFVQPLFRGPYTIQSQTMEWPFSFTIPESTQHVRNDSKDDGSKYVSGPHPLPPTFSADMRHGEAWIRYTLTAQVNPNNLIKKSKGELELRIMPTTQVPPQLTPPEVYRLGSARWSSNSLRDTQHTFKQKLAHVFSNDASLATPVIRFSATLNMPTSATPYTPLPISISIKRMLEGANDPPSPTLVLETLEFKLEALSFIRAKSNLKEYDKDIADVVGVKSLSMRRDRLAEYAAQSQLTDRKLSAEFGESGIHLQDGQPVSLPVNFMLSSLRHPGSLPIAPDFKSYTACLNHKFSVTAYIRHEESGHLFKLEGYPVDFKVLAWAVQGAVNATRGTAAEYGEDSSSFEPLPTYQAVA